ncbi:STM3941 family protein [Pedobacter caeni]|uniref:Uncharacterized protein n=1 Tax=Pedobacter caeni TaxID=288992 RepID=A0A1M5HSL7_9SPHI|nr:STM3941 family protein [Pedobacter caeni]SHG18961.1 hypothetical protein SAMN04488522_104794 [Pedobacter caeni]
MNETIIEFNNKKRLIHLFLGVIITLVCLFSAYYMIAIATKIRLFPAAMMLMLGGMGIYFSVIAVKDMLKKEHAGLILNSEGILFKGTSAAREIGLVKWSAIQSVSLGKAYGASFIFLKLQRPDDYIQNLPAQVQNMIRTNGMAVSAGELSTDLNKLKDHIDQYYRQFGQLNQ